MMEIKITICYFSYIARRSSGAQVWGRIVIRDEEGGFIPRVQALVLSR